MRQLVCALPLLLAAGLPALPTLELGDQVPAQAAKTDGVLLVSPGQFQPMWTWKCQGVEYNLGVDEAGFVQYIATSSDQVATSEGVRVGQRWTEVESIPGVRLGPWPGWGDVAVLPSGWSAVRFLGGTIRGRIVPKSDHVDQLFKGTGAGYGARKQSSRKECQ